MVLYITQAEMKGDLTSQRRWEAYDKLGTFIIYVMSFVLGIQAIGLEGEQYVNMSNMS